MAACLLVGVAGLPARGADPLRIPVPVGTVQRSTGSPAVVSTTRPLRDLAPLPPTSPKGNDEAPPVGMPIDLGEEAFIDAAIPPPGALSQPAPRLTRDFDGIRQSGRGGPPDPVGDVGLRHYVQAVNGAFAVWTKGGRKIYGPASLSTLWKDVGGPCYRLGRGDPIVQFDAFAKRWLITEFAFRVNRERRPIGPFYQCMAISRSPHPTGRYHLYPFRISDQLFPDYPKFGVWNDAYYMTVHLFDPAKGSYRAQGVYAFDRLNMIRGRPAHKPIGVSNPDFYGVLPADADGRHPPPPGTPNYLVAVDDSSSGYPADSLEIFEFQVRWENRAASRLISVASLPTISFDTNLCFGNINCIPQLGTERRLDPIGEGVLMYRLAYRNFGSFDSLVLNHVVDANGQDQAAIRWYELRHLGDGPRIYQQGTFAPDSRHRWMGSIAMDRSGNIAMGYSVSGFSMFPAIRYAGRLSGDPLGQMTRGEASIIEGKGSQTGSSRWGDYSSLSVDPRDGCTFWYTSEYYARTSVDSWRTRIGSFRFPACGPDRRPQEDEAQEPPPQPIPAPAEAPSEPSGPSPEITEVRDSPDPFSPNGDGVSERVRIAFRLSESARVTVTIKDGSGRVVRRIAHSSLTPGDWYAVWAGHNSAKRPSRPGTYAYVIRAVGEHGSDIAEGTVTLHR